MRGEAGLLDPRDVRMGLFSAEVEREGMGCRGRLGLNRSFSIE